MAYHRTSALPCALAVVTAFSVLAGCKNPYQKPAPVAPARPDGSVADVKGPEIAAETRRPDVDEPIADTPATPGGPEEVSGPPDASAPEAEPPAPCVPGAPCELTPAQSCATGVKACQGGVESCMPRALPDKTPCAHEGQTGECQAGQCMNPRCNTRCEKAEAPCTIHSWSCGTNQWAPTCAPTVESVPAGTSCGPSMVCLNGGCVMRTCTPDTPCGDSICWPGGKVRCASDVSGECVRDPALRKPDGERCDAGKVCRNGSCVDCPGEGTDCRVGCRIGKTTCLRDATSMTGEPHCALTGNVPTGRPCEPDEAGKFCREGACVACENQGTPCSMGPCKNASMRCLGGQPATCVLDGNKPNGESCGTGMLCRDGECVGACPQMGQSCATGNPCMPGTWSCQDNREVCVGRMADNGTPCGDNQVCRDGQCGTACPRAGMACTPSDRCQEGRYACQNGVEMCVNAGPRPAGTPCPEGVCTATGVCACPASATCGAAMNVCRERRRTGCREGGEAICNEDTHRADRTPCGPSRACQGGTCRDCNNANFCGSSCERCRTTVANADPVCVSGQCGFRCRAGFWNCEGRCLPAAQVTTCTSCGTCAPNYGRSVRCDNGSGGCGWACATGSHRCNERVDSQPTGPLSCFEDTDLGYCGSSCTKCMWNETCNGTRCVSTMPAPP